MQINKSVPFYANTSDDLHCYEASLRSILKYFKPEEEYNWEQMEAVTGKRIGKWTWPQRSFVWLQKHGFEIVNIEVFDYARFIAEGGKYLMEFYGEEAGREQIAHSDLVQEQAVCINFLNLVHTELRIPDIKDIRSLLQQGYLLNCLVNSAALNGHKGYVGHSIVIKGITEEEIILHDPGLPSLEDRHVAFATFEKAWGYPDKNAKNLTAVKLI